MSYLQCAYNHSRYLRKGVIFNNTQSEVFFVNAPFRELLSLLIGGVHCILNERPEEDLTFSHQFLNVEVRLKLEV